MNIRNELELQLNKPSHVVKVFDKEKGFRPLKNSETIRYDYSLNDIKNEFNSIDNFINELKKEGYGQTTFYFKRVQKIGGDIDMNETTVNLSEQTFTQATNNLENMQPTPVQTPAPNFLGNPDMQQLGVYIEAQRSGDYKKRISELEEDLKDYRSKNRRLEDENHALKLNEAISEAKTDLKIDRAILDKKSVFESEGFQKVGEALAGIAPLLFDKLSVAPAQLGGGESLTPMQSQAFELIKSMNEKQSSMALYVLQSMNKEDLIQLITNYIEERE